MFPFADAGFPSFKSFNVNRQSLWTTRLVRGKKKSVLPFAGQVGERLLGRNFRTPSGTGRVAVSQ